MSWQNYVDDQLLSTKMVVHAGIFSNTDGSCWAASSNFSATQQEISSILTKFGDVSMLAQSGVTIAGTKYMYLSSTDKVIRAKKGTSGVHIFKTKQALIVSVYEDPVVPEQCATVTEKLGEYLISVQF